MTVSKLELSPIIYGAMGFDDPGTEAKIRTIHCAIEHGITTIDTAPLYSGGESERVVGKAIADRRDKVQLLTKCGLRWDTDHGEPMFEVDVDGQSRMIRKDSRGQSLRQEIDHCLKRLNVEYIDLWQVHHLDYDTPVEETMAALQSIKESGKVREVGVSNYPTKQLLQAYDALGGELYSTQNEFSLLNDRDVEVRNFARKKGIRLLTYSPLAQGVLAGRQLLGKRPPREHSPYFHPSNLKRINHVLKTLALPLAQQHNATLAQLSLAWLLAQPGVTAAIAGASTEKQAIENAGAMQLNIPQAELQQLGSAFASCGFDPTPSATVTQRAKNAARRVKRGLGRRVRAVLYR